MRTAKPHPARVGAIFGLKPRITLGSARAGGVSPHKLWQARHSLCGGTRAVWYPWAVKVLACAVGPHPAEVAGFRVGAALQAQPRPAHRQLTETFPGTVDCGSTACRASAQSTNIGSVSLPYISSTCASSRRCCSSVPRWPAPGQALRPGWPPAPARPHVPSGDAGGAATRQLRQPRLGTGNACTKVPTSATCARAAPLDRRSAEWRTRLPRPCSRVGSVKREQATVRRSKDAFGPGVLDECGKILVLALDPVGSRECATHPSTSSVGQVHREGVGKRKSELNHVL
jgi:hypothetical protein